ncbi:MAG: hypothetical protein AAF914_09390 [Pseudomonadota bacterium]
MGRVGAALILALSLAAPAAGQDTVISGLSARIVQDGVVVPVAKDGAVQRVVLLPAPFTLDFPGGAPDGDLWITFGFERFFDRLGAPPPGGLFGVASAYARDTTPEAALFFTDPACALSEIGPGFNILTFEHRRGDGYPITAIEPDSQSRGCEVAERFEHGEDALPRLRDLHAVIVVPGQVEGAVFVIFEFPET